MLIGFIGRIGSGKDTASEHLIKRYDFVSLRLSDVISNELKWLGIKQTRENMQDKGVRLRREKGEDILMRRLFEKVKEDKNYVFNGIRHPEEANFLKQRGGVLIKVECDEKVRSERTEKRDKIDSNEFIMIDNRESERAIDKIKPDFSVNNNGTVESLYSQIDKLLKNITD